MVRRIRDLPPTGARRDYEVALVSSADVRSHALSGRAAQSSRRCDLGAEIDARSCNRLFALGWRRRGSAGEPYS
jgi:hypothetical protein